MSETEAAMSMSGARPGASSAAECYRAGLDALSRGDLDGAQRWANQCEAVAGDDASCAALRAAIASEEGDFDGELAHLRQAARLAPDDVAIARQLGEALVAGGVMGEAVTVLSAAARRNASDADLLVDLAYAQAMTGDRAAARQTIEQAALLQPDYAAVRIAQARIYEALGDLDRAAATLATVAEPGLDAGTLTDLARLCLQQERYAEADAALRRLAAADPDHDLVALHGRIWCQIRRGDWRSALELSLRATRIDRYDLTTALLAYARDRLFTRLPADDIARRERELGARVLHELHEQSELYAGLEGVGAGAGEENERG